MSRNPTVISQAELQDPRVVSKDAMSALRGLRPNFFAQRGLTGSQGDPVLFMVSHGSGAAGRAARSRRGWATGTVMLAMAGLSG